MVLLLTIGCFTQVILTPPPPTPSLHQHHKLMRVQHLLQQSQQLMLHQVQLFITYSLALESIHQISLLVHSLDQVQLDQMVPSPSLILL